MGGKFALAVLALLASAVAGAGAATYAMEGQEFMMECDSNGGVVQYWMLHSKGEIYKAGETYTRDKIQVFSNGTIKFEEVQVDYEGDHLCVTQRDGTLLGTQVAMKVRPLPPQDLWNAVYKGQFITGILAALVCAFLFTAGCLVFRYRWREPKTVLLNGREGQDNPAMDIEDNSRM